ncbi:1613_t:CDS:2 [Cetraspora pellucida]|uniref:1613_t:CDS:1 n=1 Tax=Cetraspora pellucida TaxID=1433469 RepID=A0A9N9FZJ0_9GLOM|nr:1613_t:CDS:2 [Cetraspora pellucida]
MTSSINIQYLNNDNIQSYNSLETFNSHLLINPSSVVPNLLKNEQEPSFVISNDLANNKLELEHELEKQSSELGEKNSYDKSSNSELDRSSDNGSIFIEIRCNSAIYDPNHLLLHSHISYDQDIKMMENKSGAK